MDRLEQLKNMKRKLEAQLKDVIRIIDEYEQIDAKARSLLDPGTQNLGDAESRQPLRSLVDASTRAKKPEVAAFEAVVREVLAEATRPMDRIEVLEAVGARGIRVSGAEPANTVSARLSRMADVASRRGVGYWLLSRKSEFTPSPADTPTELQASDDVEPDSLS